MSNRTHPPNAGAWLRLLIGCLALVPLASLPAAASDTPAPASVTVAGSLQDELGCSADWQPECTATQLAFDADDTVWQGTFDVPAGNWEYKAPLNGGWAENYGAGAVRDGGNIPLSLASPAAVKFYYSHETHWITSDRNTTIAVAPGSFQSELGCAGDWDPGCLRSWLQDPDGDGLFRFRTRGLPAGSYEVKVAIGESWDENYGAGGVQNGPNIAFTVPGDCVEMEFVWDSGTKVLTVATAPAAPQPSSVTVPGSFQEELGCPGDWQADCAVTHLTFDAEDTVWQQVFDLPAGSWEYKAAIDDSWDENYGADATRNGANIGLDLDTPAPVKFYYDHGTHWVTSNRNTTIAVAPGSFQSELGCAGDWDPSCLRSWLQDPDGDGTYVFSARLPAGDYEAKVAIDESWDLNFGAGGAQNGANIPFSVTAACTETFFTYDSASHVLSIGSTGGPKGNIKLAKAHWVAADTIAWSYGPINAGQTVRLHYDANGGLELAAAGVLGGASITLIHDPAGLPAAVTAKFPHLAALPAWKIAPADLPLVPAILKGQIALSAATANGDAIDATSVQIPGVLDDLYSYDGPLGATFSGGAPTLRVWAPTARSVKLHLFADSSPATPATVLPMTGDPATGVWTIAGDASWAGRYYVYDVEVFVRATGQVEHNLVTDPYSVSLSRNSQRTQIVDLADPALKPAGWDGYAKPALDAPEDITLYELHVRDFSAEDASVPTPLRGTYKAFTQTSGNGMQHLSALAQAGLTHVHLLPTFDIATIEEDKSLWQHPGDLSAYAPNGTEQQAAVSAIADQDGFNWGYDPWHYTVPEGSYATDPDGPARIREYREMVKALNDAGLRVVQDVVYNHTNAAGQSPKSVLDRIVPGYYHRLNGDGNVETSTCCQNTASEHDMMEKLLVDSAITWVTQYKVDGFRFDLMGHHMKRNILKLRQALDALTLADDGVDGSKVYIYGEGWNFGEVANNARGVQATQANMAGTGIGTFSDRLRDAVRGGGPFSGIQEQGFLNGLFVDPNATNQGSSADQRNRLLHHMDQIRVGLAGNLAGYRFENRFGDVVAGSQIDYNGQPAGYTADPQEVITYIEAHDNETLFDSIQLKAPLGTSMADRVRMQNLGMSIVALGQGIPFFHAGVDLLRSKSLDRNSFNSGDWFNKLDFTYQSNNWGVGLPPAGDNQSNWPIFSPLLAEPSLAPVSSDILSAVHHFREVLAVRRSSGLFRLRTAAEIEERLRFFNTGPGQIPALIVAALTDEEGDVDRRFERIVVVFNADVQPHGYAAAELADQPFALHPVLAASADPVVRTASYAAATGTFTVPARTAAVFVAARPLAEQIGLLAGDVDALVSQGVLNGGQGNALKTKLENALKHLGNGKPAQAAQQLHAFIQQVESLVAEGVLSAEQGAALVAAAESIIEQIG